MCKSEPMQGHLHCSIHHFRHLSIAKVPENLYSWQHILTKQKDQRSIQKSEWKKFGVFGPVLATSWYLNAFGYSDHSKLWSWAFNPKGRN
jgi:hypothetical protein